MDMPLKHDGTGWLLGSCFQYYYQCFAPLTREQAEFEDKYLIPAVRSIAADIEKSFTPELMQQYKEGVLNRGPSKFEWFIPPNKSFFPLGCLKSSCI